jgi:hypothetical protein
MSVIYDAKKPQERTRADTTSSAASSSRKPLQPVAAPLDPARRSHRLLRTLLEIIIVAGVLVAVFIILSARV